MASASSSSSLTIQTPSKVPIYLRDGNRYLKPVEAGNHKLRPLYAMVNGVPQKFPKGVYCLRYQVNGKRKWQTVGTDPQQALVQKGRLEAKLAGHSVGMLEPGAAAAQEYIQETLDHKSHKTYLAYKQALDSFLPGVSEVASLSQVTRHQIMLWMGRMKEEPLDARTSYNRVVNLKTFFLHFKTPWPLEKKDMPRYTEKPAKPYTSGELNRLLDHGTVDEVDMVMFFYQCGGREQEVAHGVWTDLSFERSVFYIQEKTERRDAMEFITKDRQEGEIPLDDELMERLRQRRERYPHTRSLVFDLATAGWVGRREDSLFLGPPGSGKSHIAQAIGHAVIQQGYRVLYREAHALLEELADATLDGQRKQHMELLTTVPLLIIDDLGMRKLPLTAAEELLEIIMRRYERASTLLTSNRPVEDWGKLLGDSAAVSAMLDRLLHHGHVLKCDPRSWRTKTSAPGESQ